MDTPVTSLNGGPTVNSPMVASDPTDRRFMVMVANISGSGYSCRFELSGDAGRRWVGTNPVPTLPTGVEECFAPEAAFDREGRLYILFVGLHTKGHIPYGAYLIHSDNRGQSFSAPRQVLGPNVFGVRMAIEAQAGRGRIHLAWLEARGELPTGGLPPGPNPILVAHSDDGGEAFSEPVQASEPNRARVVAPALALRPGGGVSVLYYDLGDDVRDYQGLDGPAWDGTWSLVLSSAPAAGAAFDRHSLVDGGIVPLDRVPLILTMAPAALAVRPDASVVVAWTDGRYGDLDLLARRSDDGATWADALRVNDDGRAGSTQYLPRLAVAPNGRVDVAYYDRREDSADIYNNAFFTYSLDAGRSFAPSAKLSRDPSHSRVGTRYLIRSAEGQIEFASRIALVSWNDRAVAAWTDTRNARADNVSSFGGPRDQAIYANQVDFL